MTKAKKKLITIPRLIILALLILVMIMGAWLGIRTLLVNALVGNIKALEIEGYEVGHGGLTMAGFPFTVIASSTNISVRAPSSVLPDPVKNWSIKADRLKLRSPTISPLSWDLQHSGNLRIDMRGPQGERYMFDIAPANIDARAAVSMKGSLKSATFTMSRAQIDALIGTPPVVTMLDNLSAEIKVSANTAKLSLHSNDIRLSPKIPGPLDNILGRKLELVELNADLENWSQLEQGGAQNWIENGGRVRADHWAMLWGPADMVGDFDISFKNGLPEGVINIRIKKPGSLIDTITDTGLIEKKQARQAKGFLSLIETGEDNRKSIQITIKDGIVKYGFVPLYEF
ncbi:MAG: DUF2125 domain-containing protein [Robiginitomaculum sp.]|nr:DUF2125 domain-containing protein [Robiginitomaculum sp.]